MKLKPITISLILTATISLADDKIHLREKMRERSEKIFTPQKRAELTAYREIFEAAEDVVIFEGLPHPDEEEALLKVELKRKDIVKLPSQNEVFYTPAVKANNTVALLELLSGPNGIRINFPKKCGFHSDYCIQFKHKDVMYRAFVCFGCSEVYVRQGESWAHFAVNKNELSKLLSAYEKKRPKRLKKK